MISADFCPSFKAWICSYVNLFSFPLRNVKPFKGSKDESFQKGGQFYSLNTQINKGVKEADKALEMDRKDRLSLVVELLPSSDEEEEEGEEENMDLDRKYHYKICLLIHANKSNFNITIKKGKFGFWCICYVFIKSYLSHY